RIETLALRHGAIDKAAAFALADPRLGERVWLAVETRKNVTVEPEAILEHLDSAGLSKYDTPEFMLPLEEIPLTATGKVRKGDLARGVAEGRLHPGQEALSP